MKTYLIIFVLALCITCWLTDASMPPVEQPIGVKGVPASNCGVKKQESVIPDFLYTDKQRNSGYITKIDEGSSPDEADFPLGTPR